ncbi:MAG: hypothetical protein CSA35_01140, partial [Dethiosulfovibrio peptidovorans]
DTLLDCYGSNVLEIGEGVDPAKVKAIRDSQNLCLTISETGEKLTLRNWYYSPAYQLSAIRFADGTVWNTDDVEGIVSGTKQACAAFADREIEESLALLSSPNCTSAFTEEKMGVQLNGWDLDPSLAVIMNGSSDVGAFETARLAMDVALAQLSFETPDSGMICNVAASSSAGMGAVRLSVSVDNGLEKHFEEGVRHAEQSRNF